MNFYRSAAAVLLLSQILSHAVQAAPKPAQRPSPLKFSELFESDGTKLKPSSKLASLNGKPVRLVGYMALMANTMRGAFYLTPRPVSCDEAGGGTADLPIETVRVTFRSHSQEQVQFVPGIIEVSGILDLGNRSEEDGTLSAIRLFVEQPVFQKLRMRARRSAVSSR